MDLVAVTGSDKPYLYDLPHLLSLPVGFEFRFRYRCKWVEDNLLQKLQEDKDVLEKSKVVILFHSRRLGRLLVLRKAEVITVERFEDIVFLRLKLGEIPDASLNDGERVGRKALGLDEGVDLNKGLQPGFYFRENQLSACSYSAAFQGEACKNWVALVRTLQEEPYLDGVPMFQSYCQKKITRANLQDMLGIEMASARVGLLSIIGTIILMVMGSLLFPDRKHV